MKAHSFLLERILRNVEGKHQENVDVGKLQADQILLYALLGDPATRLRLPDRLHGKLRRRGDHWAWQVHKPAGATRLLVGFRPAKQIMPAVAGPLEAVAARKRLRQANAGFAFAPLAELATEKPWAGSIDREGTLRLVALAPDKLYVAALELKAPATQPAKAPAP